MCVSDDQAGELRLKILCVHVSPTTFVRTRITNMDLTVGSDEAVSYNDTSFSSNRAQDFVFGVSCERVVVAT